MFTSAFQLTRSRGAWLVFPSTLNSARDISTHTLTWSVTKTAEFKPHFCAISTHTLTWSVTKMGSKIKPWDWFQLTRSRGAWQETKSKLDGLKDFNSHAHVERDNWGNPYRGRTYNFNSHAHVERDFLLSSTFTILVISTHTLTWSVTLANWLKYENVIISTHTLTWSVTIWVNALMAKREISTHTLTWSVT